MPAVKDGNGQQIEESENKVHQGKVVLTRRKENGSGNKVYHRTTYGYKCIFHSRNKTFIRADFYSEISEMQGCDFSACYEHCKKMTDFMYDAEHKTVKSLSFREKDQHN